MTTGVAGYHGLEAADYVFEGLANVICICGNVRGMNTNNIWKSLEILGSHFIENILNVIWCTSLVI
jgi:hypothetical protein